VDLKRRPILGAAALLCAVVHDGHHILRGSGHDVLWVCNVAVPLIALGCFGGWPIYCAVGLLWLCFGTPIWVLDLMTGANMIVTSPLVHVIAPGIALLALRRMGRWPSRAWVVASGLSVLLLGVSRIVGDSASNVNLAFRVHQGWEGRFHSHALFLLLLVGVSSLVFFLLDRFLFRRVFGVNTASPPSSSTNYPA
jgi:hypothetical protein